MIIEGSDLTINVAILENGAACDLTDASVILRAKTPAGTVVDWTATIDSEAGGLVHYTLAAADNDKPGQYSVWAEVTFLDTTVLRTGARVFTVYSQGTIGD